MKKTIKMTIILGCTLKIFKTPSDYFKKSFLLSTVKGLLPNI